MRGKKRKAVEQTAKKWYNKDSKLAVSLLSDCTIICMDEAYMKIGKKQYKILADSSNREFIELNIEDFKKIV